MADKKPQLTVRQLQAKRRQKIVDACTELRNDVDHYNEAHPDREPIVIDFDFTREVDALMKEQD